MTVKISQIRTMACIHQNDPEANRHQASIRQTMKNPVSPETAVVQRDWAANRDSIA